MFKLRTLQVSPLSCETLFSIQFAIFYGKLPKDNPQNEYWVEGEQLNLWKFT